MPTFPYQYKKIEFGKLFNPLVLLPIKTSWGWQNLWFLVDSGADTTMLPLEMAKRFGLKYNKTTKTKLYGIGEQAVYASPGEVVIKINDAEMLVRSYFIYPSDTVLLLGRLDIFERFTVTFDKKRQAVNFDL